MDCEPDDFFCIFLSSLFDSADDEDLSTVDNSTPESESTPEEVDDGTTPAPWNPFTSIITSDEGDDILPETDVLMSHAVYKHLVNKCHKQSTRTKVKKPYKIRFSVSASKKLLHTQYLKLKAHASQKFLRNAHNKARITKVHQYFLKESTHLSNSAKRFRSAVLLMEIYKSKENRARFVKYAQQTKNRLRKLNK